MPSVIVPDFGNYEADPGTIPWAQHWRLMTQGAFDNLFTQPGHVASILESGRRYKAWNVLTDRQGNYFKNFAHFCREPEPYGLGRDPDHVISVLVKMTGRHELESFLGKPMAVAITAPELKANGERGRDSKPRKPSDLSDKQDDYSDTKSLDNVKAFHGTVTASPIRSSSGSTVPYGGGNSAEYRAARLKRDAPEVAARLARGEFPSVSAAFREAGLERKPDPVRSVVRKTERLPPERLLEAAWEIVRRLSASDLAELVSRVQSLLRR